jgi:DNA replication protein DnaC
VPTFLEYLRHSYKTGQESESAIEYLRTVPVLALDGLEEERVTDWSIEQVFQLVNYRYIKRKGTIFTSNYSPDKLTDERVGSRCGDVMLGDVLYCGDGDIRQVQRSQWWAD